MGASHLGRRPRTRTHDRVIIRADIPGEQQLRHLGCVVIGEGFSVTAAAFAIAVSVSLLKLATPTAPTTRPFTRIGTPQRSAAMPAVTNAVRPE